jgi:protein associated with RNAse G/E
MGDVDLVMRKWDGRPHRRVTTRLLGADEFGTWLGVPAGTVVTYSYGNKQPTPTAVTSVRLIPPGAYWCALFLDEPSGHDTYCDIIAPARWESPAEVTLVDLDLDLLRFRPDGRVELDDEDEFAANTLAYGYPPAVVAHARAAAEELRVALTSGAEPFGRHWRTWMELL